MDIVLNPNLKSKERLLFRLIHSRKDVYEEYEMVDGYLIDAAEDEVRRITESLRQKKIDVRVAVLGRDDGFNRRVIETCKINMLVSPERHHTKDTLKQKDSGMNHVLAKSAVKKGILVVIDFSSINALQGKEKSQRLARIMQNIEICRKAKCAIKIASFANKEENLRDEVEMKAFLFSLGASSQQVSEATEF
jgi:RNase P/RNase MRP subunit p30